ncbi:MAG TPA: ATP synthase F0 subunit B [Kofleriaceae bacterium]|nr:ATP synthase F0 subunit B [Kofleriaceae bacterium]
MHPELVPNVADKVLVSVAEGHPLIDIDWTVLLQFGLFLAMFVLANKLLFQPYLALREKRIAGIDGARAEAERMNAEAEAKLADYEHKLTSARNKAAEETRAVRAEASKHEQEVTDKSRKAAMEAMNTAATKVKSETEAARAELALRADAIAKQMAKQLLGREVA